MIGKRDCFTAAVVQTQLHCSWWVRGFVSGKILDIDRERERGREIDR